MAIRHHPIFLFPALLALLLLSACAGKQTFESDLGIKGAPDWVNAGSQAINDRDGRLFHGVGQSGPVGDPTLQLTTADNRARAEIARALSSFMDLAATDYLQAAGQGQDAVTRQALRSEIHNFTEVNVTGARIVARWRDPATHIIYALAELDLKQVRNNVAAVEGMNAGMRHTIETRGETLFDRLLEEKRQ